MPEIDPAINWPNYGEADFIIQDYRFASGEVLPELRLHYRTMGRPRHDPTGKIVNGVLLLQGNTGTGANWLRPSLADELYGPGQPLDAAQYFFIMQNAIGRGGSSKPSDGLRGNFPHYRYRDMVQSGHGLITEHLVAAPSDCRTAPVPAAARRVRRTDRSTAASASPAHAVPARTCKTAHAAGRGVPP